MSDVSAIQNTPDISFIDDKSIEDVRSELIADFETYLTEATGEPVSLARASVYRMILNAAAAQIYQGFQYIDRAGKQNLLKYSYSDFLDNLGLWKGVTRQSAKAAVTTLRFTVSAARSSSTAIPKGTRVSCGNSMIYFQTQQYVEIPAGEHTVDVLAECTTIGEAGNNFEVGELSTFVDPLPYITEVTNLTKTEGGADVESDIDLAERIYLAPSAYSTAGPEDGYRYHAKQFNAAIGDVVVTSNQAAGQVDIVFTMEDGSQPGEEMIDGLLAYLSDKSIRPMNDYLTVSAPKEVSYSIEFTYYINRSDSARAVSIQTSVQRAVQDYIAWQRTIGRDINPSRLVQMVMAAGAKRVAVTAPEYKAVDSIKIAALSGEPAIHYGGVEDD